MPSANKKSAIFWNWGNGERNWEKGNGIGTANGANWRIDPTPLHSLFLGRLVNIGDFVSDHPTEAYAVTKEVSNWGTRFSIRTTSCAWQVDRLINDALGTADVNQIASFSREFTRSGLETVIILERVRWLSCPKSRLEALERRSVGSSTRHPKPIDRLACLVPDFPSRGRSPHAEQALAKPSG